MKVSCAFALLENRVKNSSISGGGAVPEKAAEVSIGCFAVGLLCPKPLQNRERLSMCTCVITTQVDC